MFQGHFRLNNCCPSFSCQINWALISNWVFRYCKIIKPIIAPLLSQFSFDIVIFTISANKKRKSNLQKRVEKSFRIGTYLLCQLFSQISSKLPTQISVEAITRLTQQCQYGLVWTAGPVELGGQGGQNVPERLQACPSKNFNIEKCWDSVIFALIFSKFGYVTDFFYVPDFFYVFLKNKGKNDRVPTFFYVFSKILVFFTT